MVPLLKNYHPQRRNAVKRPCLFALKTLQPPANSCVCAPPRRLHSRLAARDLTDCCLAAARSAASLKARNRTLWRPAALGRLADPCGPSFSLQLPRSSANLHQSGSRRFGAGWDSPYSKIRKAARPAAVVVNPAQVIEPRLMVYSLCEAIFRCVPPAPQAGLLSPGKTSLQGRFRPTATFALPPRCSFRWRRAGPDLEPRLCARGARPDTSGDRPADRPCDRRAAQVRRRTSAHAGGSRSGQSVTSKAEPSSSSI